MKINCLEKGFGKFRDETEKQIQVLKSVRKNQSNKISSKKIKIY